MSVATKHEFEENFFNEESVELKISTKTKELWAVEVDLLWEFDRVCKKYNIKYFLIGGTLLGAIRHKGMIPWDDDIDVLIMRDQYKKLCLVAEKEFAPPYFFQTNDTDPDSARGHAQLRNSNTTGILKSEMENGRAIFPFNQGVFIDIFPYDKIPEDLQEQKKFLVRLQKVKTRINSLRRAKYSKIGITSSFSLHGIRRILEKMHYKIVNALYQGDVIGHLSKKLECAAQFYNDSDSHLISHVEMRPNPREQDIFNLDDFSENILVRFVDGEFPAPIGWRNVLDHFFGDWQKHVIGQSTHGGLVVDVHKSYREYLR